MVHKKWRAAEARRGLKGLARKQKAREDEACSRGNRNHILNFHKRVRRASSSHFNRVPSSYFLLLFLLLPLPATSSFLFIRSTHWREDLSVFRGTRSFVSISRSSSYLVRDFATQHTLDPSLPLLLSPSLRNSSLVSVQVNVITDERPGCSLPSSARQRYSRTSFYRCHFLPAL